MVSSVSVPQGGSPPPCPTVTLAELGNKVNRVRIWGFEPLDPPETNGVINKTSADVEQNGVFEPPKVLRKAVEPFAFSGPCFLFPPRKELAADNP